MSDSPGRRQRPPRQKRVRLDLAVVARGLEESRERARRLIIAGEVTVNGTVVRVPSSLIAEDATLAIEKPLPYVSRGGYKLAHALDRFGIEVAGQVCLDAGASTGGFTDVLLQRGAARVYAADVGRGVLAWTLRNDPRVVVMEGVNVRYLRLGPAASDAGEEGSENAPILPEPVSLVVADLAFISLRVVLPALAGVLTEQGEAVTLVKPQFEAGPSDVGKGGIVRDPAVHRRVLTEVLDAVKGVGLQPRGLTASPIRGQHGNVEFLLWAARQPLIAAPYDEAGVTEAALTEASESAAARQHEQRD